MSDQIQKLLVQFADFSVELTIRRFVLHFCIPGFLDTSYYIWEFWTIKGIF